MEAMLGSQLKDDVTVKHKDIKEFPCFDGQPGEENPVTEKAARPIGCSHSWVLELRDKDRVSRPHHGMVSICVKRREMEDVVNIVSSFVVEVDGVYFVFGVFYGHGRFQATLHCKDQLHEPLYVRAEEVAESSDFKKHHLPLAHIQKIMKVDEDARMISAEAPFVSAKACEDQQSESDDVFCPCFNGGFVEEVGNFVEFSGFVADHVGEKKLVVFYGIKESRQRVLDCMQTNDKKVLMDIEVGPATAMMKALNLSGKCSPLEGSLGPETTSGKVCIRGLTVIKEYENNSKAYKTTFPLGWFHIGHIGYLDKDGYLFLIGRIKESIHHGGEKISPLEVDAVLLSLLAVAQAMAFGILDEQHDVEMNVIVVLQENMMVNEEMI
ncbi:hypothetical protein SUGI_0256640 [Cryptomeria japonica]|nr:hypothetical protein SUGI_0256640 [Cryptomeria japonica]